MQIMKDYIVLIDQHIERQRAYEQQNKEWLATNPIKIRPAGEGQSDYDPSGYSKINKGEMGS